MIEVRRQSYTAHTAAQMYALINDVEGYPTFLSWCRDSEVLLRSKDEMRARVRVGLRPLDFSFVTHNRLTPERAIDMRLVEGPFSRLEGSWRLVERGDGCEIELELQFAFESAILDRTLSAIFRDVLERLVADFCAEADRRYG